MISSSAFRATPPSPPPEARNKQKVSAFTSIRYSAIESLKPDLIFAFSDLQADAVQQLGKRGYPVLLNGKVTADSDHHEAC